MFFFSAPSLIVYVVLAVFYIANMAFFAVNRNQPPGEIINTADQSKVTQQLPQHTILESNAVNFVVQNYEHYVQPALHNDVSRQIPDNSDFFTFNLPRRINPLISGLDFYYKLFFRPPPLVG